MPKTIAHAQELDLALKEPMNIGIVDGEFRSQMELPQEPIASLIRKVKKWDDGEGTSDYERHDHGNGNVCPTPKADQQDGRHMTKIGKGAYEHANRRTPGDVAAMQVPVGARRQIMCKASQGSFAEDFLTAGEMEKCWKAQGES